MKCEECNGLGEWRIEECPLYIITDDIAELLKLAELYKKGLPPVAGGVFDQAKSFIDAVELVFYEQKLWENKLGPRIDNG